MLDMIVMMWDTNCVTLSVGELGQDCVDAGSDLGVLGCC